MRICIVKATNQIIEMQSRAVSGTLVGNAIAQGYNVEDIEEREVTPEEYEAARALDPVEIANKAAQELAAAAEVTKAQAIIDNLPSWAEVETAIKSATTIAALKVIILKLARVVYWLAKNSEA